MAVGWKWFVNERKLRTEDDKNLMYMYITEGESIGQCQWVCDQCCSMVNKAAHAEE